MKKFVIFWRFSRIRGSVDRSWVLFDTLTFEVGSFEGSVLRGSVDRCRFFRHSVGERFLWPFLIWINKKTLQFFQFWTNFSWFYGVILILDVVDAKLGCLPLGILQASCWIMGIKPFSQDFSIFRYSAFIY